MIAFHSCELKEDRMLYMLCRLNVFVVKQLAQFYNRIYARMQFKKKHELIYFANFCMVMSNDIDHLGICLGKFHLHFKEVLMFAG